MLTMRMGGYVLAHVREADYDNREAEGYYYREFDGGWRRVPCAKTVQEVKRVLLEALPESVRANVVWTGGLSDV